MKQNTSGLSVHRADDNSKATTKLIGLKGEEEKGRVSARKPRWFYKARNNVEARERGAGGTLCRDATAWREAGRDGELC